MPNLTAASGSLWSNLKSRLSDLPARRCDLRQLTLHDVMEALWKLEPALAPQELSRWYYEGEIPPEAGAAARLLAAVPNGSTPSDRQRAQFSSPQGAEGNDFRCGERS